jgi:uncharacterized protein (TIGR02611 family)
MAVPKPAEVVRFVLRSSKRIAVTVVGFALVALGLVMLVLPGPGIVVVVIGFAVLGTEYVWAATMLERTKRAAEWAGQRAKIAASTAGRTAIGATRSVGRRVRGQPAGGPTNGGMTTGAIPVDDIPIDDS